MATHDDTHPRQTGKPYSGDEFHMTEADREKEAVLKWLRQTANSLKPTIPKDQYEALLFAATNIEDNRHRA